jgi:hypothetical protein
VYEELFTFKDLVEQTGRNGFLEAATELMTTLSKIDVGPADPKAHEPALAHCLAQAKAMRDSLPRWFDELAGTQREETLVGWVNALNKHEVREILALLEQQDGRWPPEDSEAIDTIATVLLRLRDAVFLNFQARTRRNPALAPIDPASIGPGTRAALQAAASARA